MATAIMPKPEEMKLVSPPVLADKDFVNFDITNQTFTITPEAAKRLAAKLCELAGTQPYVFKTGEYELIPYPTPFVLQASGEQIYIGAFDTLTSSRIPAGPLIFSHSYCITTNLSTNVTFSIQPGLVFLNPKPIGNTPDQRRDNRIVSAVQKLFPHDK